MGARMLVLVYSRYAVLLRSVAFTHALGMQGGRAYAR